MRSKNCDVFLDVDGVLNALTLEEPTWGWPDTERVVCDGYLIVYSPEMVRRINALAERPYVRTHWLTSWWHNAPRMLCAEIGLNGYDWPVLTDPRKESESLNWSWWKLHAIRNYVEAEIVPRRVLWVDDAVRSEYPAQRWIKELNDTEERALTICPDPSEGLTPEGMLLIEEWVG